MSPEVNDNLVMAPQIDPDKLPPDELRKLIESGGLPEQPEGQAESQAEEPKAEEPAPQPEPIEDKQQEKLILGKFKSPDEVIKAYQEIEKKSTKDAQRIKSYREFMEPYVEFDQDGNPRLRQEVVAQPPTPQTSTRSFQDQVIEGLEARYNALEQQVGPVRANIILNAEIARAISDDARKPIVEFQAERNVESQKRSIKSDKENFPHFEQFENDIDNYLSQMDNKSKMNAACVKTVYKLVLGEKYRELMDRNAQSAQAQAVEIEQQKQKAEVEHQSKTPQEPDVDINKLTSKQMAEQLGLKTVD